MPADSASPDDGKLAELSAIVNAVRDRVRSRHPAHIAEGSETPPIQIALADLMPVVHARDAAQARVASIGSVNPRSGGLANAIIQTVKKSIARAFQWFVRGQIAYNRESLAATEAILEALNEHNRILVSLAGQTNEHLNHLRHELTNPSRSASVQPMAAKAARSCGSVPIKAIFTGSAGSPSPVVVYCGTCWRCSTLRPIRMARGRMM